MQNLEFFRPKADQPLAEKHMKKSSGIILLFIGLIIVLSIVQAGISNRLSVKGVLVGKIEERIDYYKTQNAILSEKLLSYSSLTNLTSRATQAGFAKERTGITLGSSVPLAVRP